MEEPGKTSARTPVIERTVDAVVVGAGFGGLYMVQKLREAGLSVQGIEAGSGVGGTWYWNRYPGARCDVPSLAYSYTWSEKLQNEWHWSEKYASQPEILRYAEYVADCYDLHHSFLFGTRVTRALFDDATGRWLVETDQGDRIAAQFCIMATGCLSSPREPDIPGWRSFGGETYLTSRWPRNEVHFSGKRVAVIGTGSSGVQSIPVIARQALQTFVFQRTPNFSLPAFNRALTEAEIAEFKGNFPAYRELLRQGAAGALTSAAERNPTEGEWQALRENAWTGGGLFCLYTFPNLMQDKEVNDIAAEFVRGKIRETVKDPDLGRRLSPMGYPIGAKRLCLDTDYYATFNLENVSLIDIRETPIEEITAEGVRTRTQSYPVDMIVFAIGFDAMTGALLNIDIRGRQGVSLRTEWAKEPKTYLGLAIAGFPNLFTITGPGSPSVLSNVITSCEQHVEWITDCVEYLRERRLATIEATTEAQEAWANRVAAAAARTLFPLADSWYLGANVPGKPRSFMPFVGANYRKYCDTVAAANYEGFRLTT